MSAKRQTYSQPQKKKVRQIVLRHAVRSLTEERTSSTLVPVGRFDSLARYCVHFAREYLKLDLSEPMAALQQHWAVVYASRVGARDPSNLKVLFLCGPDPLNDLDELFALGIAPENVWAVEADEQAFKAAAKQLHNGGWPIKLHQGSLHEFLAVVPEQFDVVYFDACGPLFGGKPKTSTVLRELFLNQRLGPLSVLITNFAATPRDTEDEWITRLHAWYAPRYFQPAWGEIDGAMAIERIGKPAEFHAHLKQHLEGYYSDFVTRFTIEFASELLPWWRVRALKGARRAYFAPDAKLACAIEASIADGQIVTVDGQPSLGILLDSTGHCQLSPDQYQFLWTVALARDHLNGNDALLEILTKDTLEDAKLCDAINAVSLVRNYFESIGGGFAQHNSDACSDALREVLDHFRWFDSPGTPAYQLFCDTPLPNLAIDLLMGVYGYPYHVNLQKLKRIEYTAKITPMYTDVFVLDQCRYMYDLVPTLAMFGDALPLTLQLQLRICMNLIRLHTHESCRDLYRGSALAGMEVEGFNIHGWPDRVVLK
ncbi:MAG TPA: class I SAM-dependent methyltransferase [Pirellulales bacterium]|jgi:hypothetical protein